MDRISTFACQGVKFQSPVPVAGEHLREKNSPEESLDRVTRDSPEPVQKFADFTRAFNSVQNVTAGSKVYGIDRGTGAIRWQQPITYASNQLLLSPHDTVYATTGHGYLYSFEGFENVCSQRKVLNFHPHVHALLSVGCFDKYGLCLPPDLSHREGQ